MPDQDDTGRSGGGARTLTPTAWTLPTLMLLSGLKGAEIQLLPASFRAMERDLHLRPEHLGVLALCQGLACVLTGPIWGNLVDSGASRKMLLKIGVALWGCASIQLAFATEFWHMAALRVLTGAALAMLLPVTQSLVADLADREEIGQYFGKIAMAANMGAVFISLIVVPIASKTILGIAGWRLMLAIVGIVSLSIIGAVEFSIYDSGDWNPDQFGMRKELKKLTVFLRNGTFRVIVLQGVFGTIPGAAQTFMIMYFQYSGISNQMCGVIMALRLIGEGIGSALGGYIGDQAHKISPTHGRVCIALCSVCLGIPFTVFIFRVLTPSPNLALFYAGIMFMQGIMTTWEVTGCINPVLVDVLPKRYLSSAFAWNIALVFASGNSIGPMLVGYLAQDMFGYQSRGQSLSKMNPAVREHNADALGHAIFWSSIGPALVTSLTFIPMLFTYPEDMRLKEEDASEQSDATPCKPTETTQLLKEVL